MYFQIRILKVKLEEFIALGISQFLGMIQRRQLYWTLCQTQVVVSTYPISAPIPFLGVFVMRTLVLEESLLAGYNH